MKEIIFVDEKFSRKLHHTLTASLNMDADLVFDDGECYFAVDGDVRREVDDYLTVRVKHKSRVLDLLCKTYNGISATCGAAADERLFFALARMAHSGYWKSLDEIESWLMDRDVPFTKQKWVDNKK
jgi:hypothetical protein